MMKRACVIRHLAFEGLGILESVLIERGYLIDYYDAGVDFLDDDALLQAHLLVVLGGPISANDGQDYPFLARETELLQQRLTLQRPTLGICLGAQLMVKALGGTVQPMGHKEIGYGDIQLSAEGLESALAVLEECPVLHWHGEQYSLPAEARLLASSALCPQQAFALGDYGLALQFHLETDYRRIEQWLIGHCCELQQAGIALADIRQQARQHGPRLQMLGVRIFHTWLGQAEAFDQHRHYTHEPV